MKKPKRPKKEPFKCSCGKIITDFAALAAAIMGELPLCDDCKLKPTVVEID